jgi:hypothetical protein
LYKKGDVHEYINGMHIQGECLSLRRSNLENYRAPFGVSEVEDSGNLRIYFRLEKTF